MLPAPPSHRRDGWTIGRQAAFLRALGLTRSVAKAARAVGMSRESAYRLRARDPHGLFAAIWSQVFAPPQRRDEIDQGHTGVIRLACGTEGASFRFDRSARQIRDLAAWPAQACPSSRSS